MLVRLIAVVQGILLLALLACYGTAGLVLWALAWALVFIVLIVYKTMQPIIRFWMS